MITRYVSGRPDISMEWWEARAVDSMAKTVFEPEHTPEFTGILDQHGTKIFRVKERNPIGFTAVVKTELAEGA